MPMIRDLIVAAEAMLTWNGILFSADSRPEDRSADDWLVFFTYEDWEKVKLYVLPVLVWLKETAAEECLLWQIHIFCSDRGCQVFRANGCWEDKPGSIFDMDKEETAS